jgi:hypothetical protein
MRIRFPWILCALLFLVIHPRGAVAAKYAGESFSIGVGVRGLGMGSAAVAVAGDVNSAAWNPATLTGVRGLQVGLLHSERFGGVVRYDYAGVARALNERTFLGFSVIRQGIGNIPVTRLIDPQRPPVYVEADTLVLNYENLRVDSDAEYLLALTCARHWTDSVDLGGAVKLLYRDVVGETAYGVGLDAGMRAELNHGVSAGVAIDDLTLSPVVWSNGTTEAILPSARLGLAWLRRLRNDTSFLIAADVVTLFEGREFAAQWSAGAASFDFSLGAEVRMAKLVAIRAGLDTGDLTAGASLRLGMADLDYAFQRRADFDDTHRLGLRLEFDR